MSKRKQKEISQPEPSKDGLKELPPIEELIEGLKAAIIRMKKREADDERARREPLPDDLWGALAA